MNRKTVILFLIPVLLSSMFYYEPKELKLTRLKVKNDKYDEALKIYEKLSEKYSQRGDFQFNWGNIYYKKGKVKEALDHYRLSLTSEKHKIPDDRVYYNMGVLLQKNKKANEAVEMYKMALIKNPKNLKAKHNLELLLRNSKKGKNKKNSKARMKQQQAKKEKKRQKKDKNKNKEKQMIMNSLQNKKEKFLPLNNQRSNPNVEKDW